MRHPPFHGAGVPENGAAFLKYWRKGTFVLWFVADWTSNLALSYDYGNHFWDASPPAYLLAARHVRDLVR